MMGKIEIWLFLSGIYNSALYCQTAAPKPKPTPQQLYHWQLPGEFHYKVIALGDRLQVPGKERLVLAGTLTQSGQTAPATITMELPASVRIDIASKPTRVLIFDGTKSSASDNRFSAADYDLLESILEDAPERLLYSLTGPSAMRIIAHRFPTNGGKLPGYKGPWEDVYEFFQKVQAAATPVVRQKHFYFDSVTRLGTRVKYAVKQSNGTTALIETQRTDWHMVNGQQVPNVITRLQNGAVQLQFNSARQSFGGIAADGLFGPQ